ncbi:hypothetical protein MN608_02949 [Microdochium nivale]|nr:hypothetical protein MN608_02949 [Microdochium nivale]
MSGFSEHALVALMRFNNILDPLKLRDSLIHVPSSDSGISFSANAAETDGVS